MARKLAPGNAKFRSSISEGTELRTTGAHCDVGSKLLKEYLDFVEEPKSKGTTKNLRLCKY